MSQRSCQKKVHMQLFVCFLFLFFLQIMQLFVRTKEILSSVFRWFLIMLERKEGWV